MCGQIVEVLGRALAGIGERTPRQAGKPLMSARNCQWSRATYCKRPRGCAADGYRSRRRDMAGNDY
ncbi:hypothetical protein CERZMDRAFT_91001 [Cercospora zeae-maydis SCOH1-5]|uniref:Uncharacterized protein n=1 Tax=Cercospora zeae-maydis SCOH1-5 TaxID=717836 RepID=A0A6A6FD41_9PEZI|nr:hypothetical protein CERZMDRAFT_91001 [Cercospora zeae-maydis SCOH1-5]